MSVRRSSGRGKRSKGTNKSTQRRFSTFKEQRAHTLSFVTPEEKERALIRYEELEQALIVAENRTNEFSDSRPPNQTLQENDEFDEEVHNLMKQKWEIESQMSELIFRTGIHPHLSPSFH